MPLEITAAPNSDIHNIGLLNTRQNGVIVGVGFLLLGAVLLVVDALEQIASRR